MSAFGRSIGTIELFATKTIAGVYHESMNVYKDCAEYVIASGRAQPVFSDSTSDNLQLSDIQRMDKGLFLSGALSGA